MGDQTAPEVAPARPAPEVAPARPAPEVAVVVVNHNTADDLLACLATLEGAGTDEVVVVDVPLEVQIERLQRERGMSVEEARSRIAAQASREERLAAADHVMVNDRSPEQLRDAVEKLWNTLTESAALRT